MKALAFSYRGEPIPVQHEVHRRYKRIHLHVRPDHILIKSPGVPRKRLHHMLQENTAWIEETLSQQYAQARLCPRQALYLGVALPLVYTEACEHFQHHADHFMLPVAMERDAVLRAMKGFYAQQAQHYLPDRLGHWSAQMNVRPQQVRLKYLKSRWGSCSARGNINLNVRAMQLPRAAIDSILIHELAHLRYLNHGPAFWQLVHQFCPDYAVHHQLIKKLGPQLI